MIGAVERLERHLARLARWQGVWPLFAIVSIFVWLFRLTSRRFSVDGGPDWASLQLSFDPGTFRHVLALWSAASVEGDAMEQARAVLWRLDLVFPFAYAAFLSAAYWWFLNTRDVPAPEAGQSPVIPTIRPSRLRLVLPWIAAFFDLVENVLLLALIPGSEGELPAAVFPPSLVWVMSVAAALKWTFVLLAGLSILQALFSGPRGDVLRLSRYSLLSIALGSLPLALSDQGLDLVTSLAESDRVVDAIRLLVATWVWAASVWYWSRVLLDAAGWGSTSWTFIAWSRWVPRVLGTLTLAAPALAFVRAIGRPQGAAGVFSPVALAWVFLISAGMFFALVTFRRAILHTKPPAHALGFGFRALPAGTRWVIAASLVVSLSLFAGMTSQPVTAGAWLGAPTILVITAANTVFFGSLAVFASRTWRVPLDVVALVAAAVCSAWNDNHTVRTMPSEEPLRPRPASAAAFAPWVAQHPAGPLVIVAAEGGGIRAAYWTAAVLARVYAQVPDVRTRIVAVSGVSGGSVGGAVYAALVRDRRDVAAEAAPLLADGFLAPILARMVTGDFLQWFLPLPVPAFDRSIGFESAVAAAYQGRGAANRPPTFTAAFLDLQPDARAGVPALYLTSVSVETGARVIVSPYSWPGDGTRRDRLDFHDLTRSDLTLASAVHNSARFTYVSPAGLVRSDTGENRGHVVDGGYFENTGIETAVDVMDALDPSRARRFVVLVLCNTPGGCLTRTEPVEPQVDLAPDTGTAGPGMTSWRKRQSLGELLSPVRALLATREMRGHLARARLNGRAEAIEFGICDVDAGAPRTNAPLGWQLSAGARRTLDDQVEHCTAASIQRLREALVR